MSNKTFVVKNGKKIVFDSSNLEELAKVQGYKSQEDKLENFKFKGPNKGYIPITQKNIQYH